MTLLKCTEPMMLLHTFHAHVGCSAYAVYNGIAKLIISLQQDQCAHNLGLRSLKGSASQKRLQSADRAVSLYLQEANTGAISSA